MNRSLRTGAVVVIVAVASTVAWRMAGADHHSRAVNATGTNPTTSTARVQRTDLVATEQVTGTLGYPSGSPVVDRLAGTYTALPAEGTIVSPGHSLFSVDSQPVVLFTGSIPAWRPFEAGMSDGIDIAQLQLAFVALRIAPDLRVDGHFGRATIAAVVQWQRALGLPQTGAIDLGRVTFRPGAVRVGAYRVAVGDPAVPGQVPYTATGATRAVTIALDVARQAGVDVGEPVTVELPSGHTTPGRVSIVGRIAHQPTDQASSAPPTITVTVALDNPSATGALDEQPVAVDLTTATRKNVLVVPITALLALREGGFGVEVIAPNGPHRVVAVTPGLFTQTLVEIAGTGISTTTNVVTAQ